MPSEWRRESEHLEGMKQHTCNNQERENLGSSQAGASQRGPPPASSLLPNPYSCPSPLPVTPGKAYHILLGWSHQAYPAGKFTHLHWLESSPPGSDLSTSSTQAPRRPTQGHTRSTFLSLDIFFNTTYTYIFIIEFQMSSLGIGKLRYDVN